jgi:hypothetical protein
MKTKTEIYEIGKTYRGQIGYAPNAFFDVRFLGIDAIYFYGATVLNGDIKYYVTGYFSNIGTNQEAPQYNYRQPGEKPPTEAEAKEWMHKSAADRVAKLARDEKAKAEKELAEKKQAEQLRDIAAKQAEVKKTKAEAVLELKAICNAKDFQAVLKDKRAKELIEKISFIDAYSELQFNKTF